MGNWRLLIVMAFLLSLAGCGGGGGGSSDDDSTTTDDTTTPDEGSSNWDQMVWDQDDWA